MTTEEEEEEEEEKRQETFRNERLPSVIPSSPKRSQAANVDRRRSSMRRQTITKAFSYSDEMTSPTMDEWKKLLKNNITEINKATKDQIFSNYNDFCKEPLGEARDWNQEFQAIIEKDYKGDDAHLKRIDRLELFFDNLKSVLIQDLSTIIQELHSDEKTLKSTGTSVEDVLGTYHLKSNIFCCLSTSSTTFKSIARSHARVINTAIVALTSPMTKVLLYKGFSFLIIAKVPMSAPNPVNSSVALGKLLLLQSALGDEKNDKMKERILRSTDAKYHLVVPPFDEKVKDANEQSLRWESGILLQQTTHLTTALEGDFAKEVVNKIIEKDYYLSEFLLNVETVHKFGLRISQLPILLEYCLSNPNENSTNISNTIIAELVCRTVKSIAVSELCRSGSEDILERANRIFYHVLVDQSTWDSILIPLTVEKYPRLSTVVNNNNNPLSWSVFMTSRESRQMTLRRLCNLLGIATSNQRVASFVSVSSSDITSYLPHHKLLSWYYSPSDCIEKVSNLCNSNTNRKRYAAWLLSRVLYDSDQTEDLVVSVDSAFNNAVTSPAEGSDDITVSSYCKAHTLFDLSNWLSDSCRNKHATDMLDKALEILEEKIPDSEEFDLRCCSILFRVKRLSFTGDDNSPKQQLSDCISILSDIDQGVKDNCFTNRGVYSIYQNVLLQLSAICQQLSDPAEAEKYLLRLVSLLESAKLDTDDDLAYACTELGNAFMAQKKYDLACERFEQALASYQKRYGSEHPDTATALNNLACYYYNMGNQEKKNNNSSMRRLSLGSAARTHFIRARSLLQQVISLPEEIVLKIDDNNCLTAGAYSNLASVEFILSDYSEAEHHCERALQMYEEAGLPSTHNDVINANKNLTVIKNRRRSRSALVIQAAFRGWKGREETKTKKKRVKQREEAATRIQSFQRGRTKKEVASKSKSPKEQPSSPKANDPNQAATKIQALHRGNASRSQVAKKKNSPPPEQERAATKIQSLHRGNTTRKQLANKTSEPVKEQPDEDKAAVKIQSLHRGNAARKQASQKKSEQPARKQTDEDKAATKIQSLHRGNTSRKRVAQSKAEQPAKKESMDEEKAATKIQSLHRGNAARKQVAKKKSEQLTLGKTDEEKENKPAKKENMDEEKAATKIQSLQRGNAARKQVAQKTAGKKQTDEDKAATKIQSLHRGNNARRQAAAKKPQTGKSNQSEENKAATKIQALHRGNTARQQLPKKQVTRESDVKANEETSPEQAAKIDEDKAAVKIQSLHRGNAARKELTKKKVTKDSNQLNEDTAATRIQALQRGKIARKEVTQKKALSDDNSKKTTLGSKDRAATKIQARHRGNLARGQLHDKREQNNSEVIPQQNEAATKIQAVHRGRIARKEVTSMKNNKKHLTQSKPLTEDAAATKIQALHRGNTSRTALSPSSPTKSPIDKARKERETEAATKIQALQRGRMARKQVSDLKAKKQLTEKTKKILSEDEAASKIQSLQRGNVSRKKTAASQNAAKDDEKAAIKIQALQRGNAARKTAAQRAERKQKENQAAIKIQVLYLTYLDTEYIQIRKKKKEKQDKKKKKQSVQKGRATRHETEKVKTERSEAAVKIQSLERGRKERKLAKEKHEIKQREADEEAAAIRIQSVQRKRIAVKHTNSLKENQFKEKEREESLQLAEERARLEVQSAIKLQSFQRGNRDRRKASHIKQQKQERGEADQAALVIQRNLRGYNGRNTAVQKQEHSRELQERRKREREAATSIQSAWRGKMSREAVEKKRELLDEERALLAGEKRREDERKYQQGNLEDQAATRIQALQRGRQGRRRSEIVKREKDAHSRVERAKHQSQGTQSHSKIQARMTKHEDDVRLAIEIDEATARHGIGMESLENKYWVDNKNRKRSDLIDTEATERSTIIIEHNNNWKSLLLDELVTRLGEDMVAKLEREQSDAIRREGKKRREQHKYEKLTRQTIQEEATESKIRITDKEERIRRLIHWNALRVAELNGNDPVKARERRRLYVTGKHQEQQLKKARQDIRTVEKQHRARLVCF